MVVVLEGHVHNSRRRSTATLLEGVAKLGGGEAKDVRMGKTKYTAGRGEIKGIKKGK